jgi:hypothetical protein
VWEPGLQFPRKLLEGVGFDLVSTQGLPTAIWDDLD